MKATLAYCPSFPPPCYLFVRIVSAIIIIIGRFRHSRFARLRRRESFVGNTFVRLRRHTRYELMVFARRTVISTPFFLPSVPYVIVFRARSRTLTRACAYELGRKILSYSYPYIFINGSLTRRRENGLVRLRTRHKAIPNVMRLMVELR